MGTRIRTSPISEEKQGVSEQTVQNPAQLVSKNDENPDLTGTGQAVETVANGNPHPLAGRDHSPAESPRKDSHKSQNSSGLELDRLAAILRAIPAENRADFLRSLADYLDHRDKL